MDPTAKVSLGGSDVQVTRLGLGGAPYASLVRIVSERDAFEVIGAAWDAGVRYFDTSPWYGRGLSELRTGRGLHDKPRDQYVLSSKVGRWLKAQEPGSAIDTSPWRGGLPFDVVFDYTYDGIMRAYEQSQLRLGLPWYDVAVIHDLDFRHHVTETRVQAYLDQLTTSGWRAIEELRTHRLIRAIGAGVNELGMIPRFLDAVQLDFFLVAMPYTLLSQDVLESEFPLCESRGVDVVIGSPYMSGILAGGAVEGKLHDYQPPSAAITERVRRIEAVCARHDVPIAAAALQFVMHHPIVKAVIPGARSAEQVERNVATFRREVPVALWAELKHEGLLREDAPTPD